MLMDLIKEVDKEMETKKVAQSIIKVILFDGFFFFFLVIF